MVQNNKPKQLTAEEKKNQTMLIIGLVVTGVVIYFMYKWFIDPFGSLFGLSKGWKIGISIFAFFVGFGFWSSMQNTLGFFEKANKKLSQETQNSTTTKTTPEDKLIKLKELKDSGVITAEEFKEKKQKLLDKI